MAMNTFNTKLTIAEKEYPIKDFPSILGKRSALETTTLSDDAQTYISGIRQTEESFDFGANYSASDYDTINKLEGDQECKLTFGDGSSYSWSGSVSASINEGGVDEVLGMTISVTPSTVPVWANATT